MTPLSRDDVQRMKVAGDLDGLIQALEAGDKLPASDAAHALENLDDPRALQALIQALKNKNIHPWARRAVAGALAKKKDPAAIEPLLETFYEDPDVRPNAVWALRDLGQPAVEPLLQALKKDDREIHERAADALGRMGASVVEPLVRVFLDEDTPPSVRKSAAGALVKTNDERASEAFQQALGDIEPETRRTAAWALGRIKEPAAVGSLIERLKDGSPDVRTWTVYALKEIGSTEAIEPLLHLVKDDQEEKEIRGSARKAIEGLQSGSDQKVPPEDLAGADEEEKEDPREGDRLRLRTQLGELLADPQGWEPAGLGCPRCKSKGLRTKQVEIIGYLFLRPPDIPDTLLACEGCGHAAGLRGGTEIIKLDPTQPAVPSQKANDPQSGPEVKGRHGIESVQGTADSIESAFQSAKDRLPPGVLIVERRELAPPKRREVTIQAFDEEGAREQAESEIEDSEEIVSLTLNTPAKRGFLGIGKEPGSYEALLVRKAVVEISFQHKTAV